MRRAGEGWGGPGRHNSWGGHGRRELAPGWGGPGRLDVGLPWVAWMSVGVTAARGWEGPGRRDAGAAWLRCQGGGHLARCHSAGEGLGAVTLGGRAAVSRGWPGPAQACSLAGCSRAAGPHWAGWASGPPALPRAIARGRRSPCPQAWRPAPSARPPPPPLPPRASAHHLAAVRVLQPEQPLPRPPPPLPCRCPSCCAPTTAT